MTVYNLEDFDDTFFVVGDINSLEYFAVFASTQLPDQLIVVLLTAAHSHNISINSFSDSGWLKKHD